MRDRIIGIMVGMLGGLGFLAIFALWDINRNLGKIEMAILESRPVTTVIVTNTVTPVEIRTERVIERGPRWNTLPETTPLPWWTYTNCLPHFSNGVQFVITPCVETGEWK